MAIVMTIIKNYLLIFSYVYHQQLFADCSPSLVFLQLVIFSLSFLSPLLLQQEVAWEYRYYCYFILYIDFVSNTVKHQSCGLSARSSPLSGNTSAYFHGGNIVHLSSVTSAQFPLFLQKSSVIRMKLDDCTCA